MRHVGEEFVLHPARFEHRQILLLQLGLGFRQCGVGPSQIIDQRRLLGGRSHLRRHDAQQPTPLGAEPARIGEVERDRAQDPAARLQRQCHERTESKLARDFLPIFEARVREHIRDFDRAALARRLAARSKSEPHSHLAEPRLVALWPVVRRRQPHQLGRAIDQIDRRECRAHHRTHPLEREAEHLFGPVRGQKRMNDLTHRHQFPDRCFRSGRSRTRRRRQSNALGGSRERLGQGRLCSGTNTNVQCQLRGEQTNRRAGTRR